MSSTFNLRPYQETLSKKASQILSIKKIVVFAIEVRCGKTHIALETAKLINANKVLFVTKKKAISSIKQDYIKAGHSFKLITINYESLHKILDRDFDLIVCDESHTCFVGSTPIDGVEIKDINLQDSLKTFNFTKGVYEYKKVVRKHKYKLNKNLIKIKCNGKEIICTEDHKIFTKRGWVRAIEILPSDELQVV